MCMCTCMCAYTVFMYGNNRKDNRQCGRNCSMHLSVSRLLLQVLLFINIQMHYTYALVWSTFTFLSHNLCFTLSGHIMYTYEACTLRVANLVVETFALGRA